MSTFRPTRPSRRPRPCSRPLLESLEPRSLLATFTVASLADAGPGSLRAAIEAANADPDRNTIRFDIPGPGPHSIRPATPLPTIVHPVVIDGTTEPDFTGTPIVELDGTDVVGKSGEKLGKIEDVAIEKVSGDVAYAILSFGGVLGIGAKYHPVPWKLLKYDTEQRAYVVPMTKDDLHKAPMIDENEMSGWNDSLSRDAIYGYYSSYGVGPYWG